MYSILPPCTMGTILILAGIYSLLTKKDRAFGIVSILAGTALMVLTIIELFSPQL